MLNLRIGISAETVKALEATLRAAYRAGDSGLVKKVTGKDLSHEPLMGHLREKAARLYGV